MGLDDEDEDDEQEDEVEGRTELRPFLRKKDLLPLLPLFLADNEVMDGAFFIKAVSC